MRREDLRTRLADAHYQALHLAAIAALSKVDGSLWYDAKFLRRYEAAQIYLQNVAPAELKRFLEGFAPLQQLGKMPVQLVDAPFQDDVQNEIADFVSGLPKHNLKQYELQRFGRYILHDHPLFVELQRDLLPLVSELGQCELAVGYNFLSLYDETGRCEVHMDQPVSMFTLDYCINQSEAWPISFSKPVDWPALSQLRDWSSDQAMSDPDLEWEDHVLEPGQALMFCGSSRWHHRKAIAPGGFCNLLFFHFYPAGMEGLIHPHQWAEYFDLPDLQPFCDLLQDGETGSVRRAFGGQ